jgi:molybdopterin molybdotransferase
MMVSVEEARRLIHAHVAPVAAEALPLLEAFGRVVASPVTAPMALPPVDLAEADGFAVRAADLAGASGAAVTLPLAGAIAAGTGPTPLLPPGHAMRIVAGAPMPAGADAVVPWEEAGEPGARISLPAGRRPDPHVQRAGTDVATGARVLEPGQPLNAPRIALLAALGRTTAIVYAPLRVAVVTIGGHLAEPGTPLAPGQAYDGNAYALMAALAEAGAHPVRIRCEGDDPEEIKRALRRALVGDVVVTIGGLSAGEYDQIGPALADLGRVHFAEVAQDPGQAFSFATVRGTPVFALPARPVAAALCLEVFVRPALRRMMGHASQERPRVMATVGEPFPKRAGRDAWLRACVTKAGSTYHARALGPAASALGTLAAANAILHVPAASQGYQPGDLVETMLLEAPELCGMACLPVGGPAELPMAAG